MNLLGSHSTEIISILENNLIKSEEGLHKQYQLLEVYGANDVDPKTGFISKQFLNPEISALKQVQAAKHLAIDLPVFLTNESAKSNVMICAMDPLSEHKKRDKIGLWNPFSILRNPVNHKGSDAANHSFFTPLKNEFNLYITDIYKLYFMYEGKKSNKISAYTKINVHKAILELEIKIIKPEFIITLGNSAKDALLNVFNNNESHLISRDVEGVEVYESVNLEFKIICLPHISRLASANKNKLLEGKNIEGKYINEKLARFVITILNKQLTK